MNNAATTPEDENSEDNSTPTNSAPNTETNSTSNETPPENNTTPENTTEEQKDDTPEWFMKDKFKSIDEQAKSYNELSKKMGKYWGSPQNDYSFDGIDSIEPNDPLVANLAPVLKDMGISQEGFKHLVNSYMEANKAMVKEMENELRKTLTETDVHTYRSIDKWMTDNLTKEEMDIVKNNWLMSAADFKLFNQLRLMAAPSTNVPSNNQNAAHFESTKQVENDKIKYRKEVKAGIRAQDKNYEDELAARFRDAAARELRSKRR